MKVRALRGVCIGPCRHLKAGETADVDAATFQFLSSIKAVEAAPPEEVKPHAPVAEQSAASATPTKGK